MKRTTHSIVTLLFLTLVQSIAATPLDHWSWRNPLPQGNNLNSITFAQGSFLAVGDAGAYLVSTNGVDWRLGDNGFALQQAVVYGDGKFVAGGPEGGMYSSDLLNWSTTTFPAGTGASQKIGGLAYGNGVFVAVGPSYFQAYSGMSSNGASWQNFSSPVPFNAIAFGNGRFLAAAAPVVGVTTALYTSTNGSIWINSGSITSSVVNIGFEQGLFFALGRVNGKSAIHSSPDGSNWTSQVQTTPDFMRSVTWGKGVFVAVGESVVMTSADGVAWTSQSLAFNGSFRGVAFGNDKFVAVGAGGNIFHSTDATNWIALTVGDRTRLRGVASGNDHFIAVGSSGRIVTSPDGKTWTPRDSGTSVDLYSAAAGNGIYVVGAATGAILSSTNAVNWNYHNFDNTNRIEALTFGGGRFVGAGLNGVILTSTNGATWEACLSGTTNLFSTATYGNGIFLVGGSASGPPVLCKSTNGVDWTLIPPPGNEVRALTFGRGLFVLCDLDGYIYTSPDAINWSNRVFGNRSTCVTAAYGGGMFVALDYKGCPRVSGDTINWNYKGEGWLASYDLRVAFGKGTFVAVGANGTIIQSDPVLQLRAGARSGNSFNIVSEGEIGPMHTLQWSSALADWTDLTIYPQDSAAVSVVDSAALDPQRFYRIKPE